MKRLLLTLIIGLTMTSTVPTMAKHGHRTTSSVVNHRYAGNNHKKDTATAVVAYSDTTSTAGTDADEDSLSATVVNVPTDSQMKMVSEIMGNTMIPIAVVFIVCFLAPVVIVGLVIYFIVKSRNQKIKLAELAIRSGQPIPEFISKKKESTDQILWAKGVKRVFLAVGLALMFLIMGFDSLWGIGLLIAVVGAGQCVIAKTTKSNGTDSYAPNGNGEVYGDAPQPQDGKMPRNDSAMEYADDIKD